MIGTFLIIIAAIVEIISIANDRVHYAQIFISGALFGIGTYLALKSYKKTQTVSIVAAVTIALIGMASYYVFNFIVNFGRHG